MLHLALKNYLPYADIVMNIGIVEPVGQPPRQHPTNTITMVMLFAATVVWLC